MTLRAEAEAIWKAGVKAVDPKRCLKDLLSFRKNTLGVGEESYPLDEVETIAVVGAGKAGAGMAEGLEAVLDEETLRKVAGWVNVPEGCERELDRIHLHVGRPATVNEPTSEGVRGTEAILKIVSGLSPGDLCIVLLSGGGSALLPAPVRQIGLADKQQVTRSLSEAGASIQELNLVRRHLSRVKGGGLCHAVGAKRVLTLIISDIVGDPLDAIASGPTVPSPWQPRAALEVLKKYDPSRLHIPQPIYRYLENEPEPVAGGEPDLDLNRHVIVANNATALEAAANEAEKRGYRVLSLGSDNTGEARKVGTDLYRLARDIRDGKHELSPPVCILSGGEPVVQLATTNQPRKGGRNQELVLGAIREAQPNGLDQIVLLSGGTDGEDGPTDAAGAIADADLLRAMHKNGLMPETFLSINNAYPFFEETDGLLKTGPTGTNVMDLRVVLIEK